MSALPAPIDIINNSAAHNRAVCQTSEEFLRIYSVCNENY